MASRCDQTDTLRRGPGRRLDESRDPAILQAAIEALADVGYDRLTMDMVAQRAHAGKGALYRRWPSKAELVIDAVSAIHAPCEAPDTGSLDGDFAAMVAASSPLIQDKLMRSVLAGLATAASREPKIAAALGRKMMELRTNPLRVVLERAANRGEVAPGRDLELILEIVPAVLFAKSVLSPDAIDPELMRRILSEIVYPLVAAERSPVPDA